MTNPYKTRWYNRQPLHWLQKSISRDDGTMSVPECIHLAPEEGAELSGKEPVRIFLGTEPGQYRATRVFVWSVMQVRDKTRPYEIHLMSNLTGIDRTDWKTGFTNYRYAIPHFAGNKGRAIYNDVDQVYLSDPAILFDMEMDGKGVLATSEKENSVMLIDCEAMASHWALSHVQSGKKHAYFKGVVSENNLFGAMPGTWNSLDGQHPIEEINCLHYTTLHAQPWKPFPDVLKYQENPLGKVWHDLEQQADADGYLLFTRDLPSNESKELISLYQKMHEGGQEAAEANPDVPQPFAGWSLLKHTTRISDLIAMSDAKTMLDYGAGKASSYKLPAGADPDSPMRIHEDFPELLVRCYDPGYPPFATLDSDMHDGVISTDVVEHLAPFDVPWVFDEIFARSRSFVYIVAACYPAKKTLPGGRNAHSTNELPYWWHQQIALTARRYPNVHWVLACEIRSLFGGKRQVVFDQKSPSPLS